MSNGGALKSLLDLRSRMIARAAEFEHPEQSICFDRLGVIEVHGELHLDFYGDPFQHLPELLAILASATVAPLLASLRLQGPDEGANGTRNWDLDGLVDGQCAFPRLRYVEIQQNKPGDHNQSIVASSYEEAGVLARLLTKAPTLEFLASPSAPDSEFLQVGERPMRYLNIDAGYDTQGFIGHLSRSSCFPRLQVLEFGEYSQTYMEDFASRCTPLSEYKDLFASKAFASVKHFVWRNPACSDTEIGELRSARKDVGLLVVRTSATYLR